MTNTGTVSREVTRLYKARILHTHDSSWQEVWAQLPEVAAIKLVEREYRHDPTDWPIADGDTYEVEVRPWLAGDGPALKFNVAAKLRWSFYIKGNGE